MNIGIVNDSPLAVEAMRRAIALRAEHRVLWVATDGAQAVDFCVAQPPGVVLMDLIMPKFDGVEATRRIMAQAPCPVLVVTSSVGANAWRVYEAMAAGALDAVDTPTLADNRLGDSSQPLLAKIDQIGRLLEKPAVAPAPRPGVILGQLPADFGAAIVMVQHVDKAFAEGMAQWLDGQTELTVRVAVSGDTPKAGEALLAATNDHLYMTRSGSLDYTPEPAATPYRPSVDVFFHSVVEYWRGDAIGVLLTGMGRDGAIGLKAMRAKGYRTIAQDQASCAVYGMPKAAAALDAASRILPLGSIAAELVANIKR
jgi:two-component system response regulator WspF